jgi:hypothetical protein
MLFLTQELVRKFENKKYVFSVPLLIFRFFVPLLFLNSFVFSFVLSCSGKKSSSEVSTDSKENPVDSKESPVEVSFSDLAVVVPSDGLPSYVKVLTSNNNLDVVVFQGRVFLAFRTAPSHFASDKTKLYIVSSEDEKTWKYEGEFFLGRDLREPRFLAIKDKLFIYFAVLGKDPLKFEPGFTLFSLYQNNGWSETSSFPIPTFIPWRIKSFGDYAVMFGYAGGESVYNPTQAEKVKVYMLKTSDGVNWEPFWKNKEVIMEGGCSETDGEFDDNGDLYLVCRNELGDEFGFGSKICLAKKGNLDELICKADKRKFDSPLLFKYKSYIFLIARRNLSDNGFYDIAEEGSHFDRYLKNQIEYWNKPKRCSVWLIKKEDLTAEFLYDLPSKGDTCFPSIFFRNEIIRLYNYTSDINGPDISWQQGQLLPTFIVSGNLIIKIQK